jgi:hypothetical protein
MFFSKLINGKGFVSDKTEVRYKLTGMNLCPHRKTMELTFWKGEVSALGATCFQIVIGKRDWEKIVTNIKTVKSTMI